MKKTALLMAVVLLTALFAGCDGKKLTGSKGGLYDESQSKLDFEEMADSGVKTKQEYYDRIYKKVVQQEWLKEAYENLYRAINSFESRIDKNDFDNFTASTKDKGVVTAVVDGEDIHEASHAVEVLKLADSTSPAEVKIDGKAYFPESNKLKIGELTYSFTGLGKATVIARIDTDKMTENIKEFIESYNALFGDIQELYNTAPNPDCDVLTKQEEEEMSDVQIEKWNEKAKQGILYHDKILGKMMDDMREAIYQNVESVDSTYNTLMSIGISFGNAKGILELDESILRAALAAKPIVVRQLFVREDSMFNNMGAQSRLRDRAEHTKKVIEDKESAVDNEIIILKDKLEEAEEVLNKSKNTIKERYEGMEETLAQKLDEMKFNVFGD